MAVLGWGWGLMISRRKQSGPSAAAVPEGAGTRHALMCCLLGIPLSLSVPLVWDPKAWSGATYNIQWFFSPQLKHSRQFLTDMPIDQPNLNNTSLRPTSLVSLYCCLLAMLTITNTLAKKNYLSGTTIPLPSVSIDVSPVQNKLLPRALLL